MPLVLWYGRLLNRIARFYVPSTLFGLAILGIHRAGVASIFTLGTLGYEAVLLGLPWSIATIFGIVSLAFDIGNGNPPGDFPYWLAYVALVLPVVINGGCMWLARREVSRRHYRD